MSFLEKVSKINWATNDTGKIEQELQAARCFMPPDPPDSDNTTSFPDLFSKDKSKQIKIARPNPKRYIPGKVFFPKDVDSVLSKQQQAICLSVLQFYQKTPDSRALTTLMQHNLHAYQALQSTIQEENTKFSKYVEEDWKKYSGRASKIKPSYRNYARLLWEKKLLRCLAYPELYNSVSTISLVEAPSVDVSRVQEVVQFGTIAEFTPPSLLLRFTPMQCTLPNREEAQLYNSKFPVSQDDNVEKILGNHEVDVVISTSALKLLMDSSDYNIGWIIPIIVKQRDVKQENESVRQKNVVYIDKPFPKTNPNNMDFNMQCHKRLVRTNLCIFPKVVYPNSESTKVNPLYDENCDENKKDAKDVDPLPLYNKTVKHNASYDIWNIKLKEEENQLMKTKVSGKEIKVLIRYKFDACESLANGEMRPLVVVPKLEYQLEHGANIATKSELIREWTSLFFRPFSHLYRVRMQVNTSEVVSIESVNLQKINTEAANYHNDKPHCRLGALYKVFAELMLLKAGSYLIQHTAKNGPFASILKSVDSNTATNANTKTKIFNLHSEYNNSNCKIVPAPKQWCPIDVHYILPVHATYKRMPGMFKPLLAAKKAAQMNKLKQQKKNAARKKKKRNALKNQRMLKEKQTKIGGITSNPPVKM